jgi:hypothetical protein
MCDIEDLGELVDGQLKRKMRGSWLVGFGLQDDLEAMCAKRVR